MDGVDGRTWTPHLVACSWGGGLRAFCLWFIGGRSGGGGDGVVMSTPASLEVAPRRWCLSTCRAGVGGGRVAVDVGEKLGVSHSTSSKSS